MRVAALRPNIRRDARDRARASTLGRAPAQLGLATTRRTFERMAAFRS